jgi:hypothetical protein
MKEAVENSGKPRRVQFLILVAVLVAVSFGWFHLRTNRRHGWSGATVRIGLDGLPSFVGIPLGTGRVRDITFQTLHWLRVPVDVVGPDEFPLGNDHTFNSNFSQTMQAVDRAHLLPSLERIAAGLY